MSFTALEQVRNPELRTQLPSLLEKIETYKEMHKTAMNVAAAVAVTLAMLGAVGLMVYGLQIHSAPLVFIPWFSIILIPFALHISDLIGEIKRDESLLQFYEILHRQLPDSPEIFLPTHEERIAGIRVLEERAKSARQWLSSQRHNKDITSLDFSSCEGQIFPHEFTSLYLQTLTLPDNPNLKVDSAFFSRQFPNLKELIVHADTKLPRIPESVLTIRIGEE